MDKDVTLMIAVASGLVIALRTIEFLVKKALSKQESPIAVVAVEDKDDKILEFLKDMDNKIVPLEDFRKLERQTQELHTWHDKEDEDGRKAWYAPKNVHEQNEKVMSALTTISENLFKSTMLQEKMIEMLKDMQESQRSD